MAKKTTEKDVLIVRDEKTGEISVVAGLNADGSPKRTPAKAENAQSFLQFDRHGDVLDNFFKNFFRQCKEPSRFGFYRIAADQAENLLEVMKQLLKDPEANKELLAPHKVDTSDYEKKVCCYLCICLRYKRVCKIILVYNLVVVLNDTIVDECDISNLVRMSIGIGNSAVCCPSCMSDSTG